MEASKKTFLKNLVGFSMTTWIGFVLGFIATPIATRLFAPGELGKVTLFGTYATLFSSFCYLGLDQAFVRFYLEPPGNGDRRGMLAFSTAVSGAFCVLLSLGLLVAWRQISAQVTGEPDFGIYLCLCLFSLSSVVFRYLSLSYRMEQNARLYTVQGVLQVLLTKIAYLAVGFRTPLGRPAILLLTALMAAFTAIYALLQRKRFDFGYLRRADKPFATGMGAFAAPLIPLALMTWLNGSVSTVVLRNMLDISAVGVYTSALGLAATVNIIQSGFNAYWAPYVYENYQSDRKNRFFTVHRLMACLLTGFGLTLTLLQVPVFLLLGEKYRASVVYFPFLFLSPICYCLSETTGMGIGIAKKSYWNTVIFLVSALANLLLCVLLIPPLGPAGAAMASSSAAVVALAMRTWAGERYYKAITDYRYVAYTVGLMLAASLANYLLHGAPAAQYAVLAAVYGLALWLFRRELGTLWATGRQILHEGAGALRRRANTP